MDIREVVIKALAQLGIDPLAVAETLYDKGFRSDVHVCDKCPVATYLEAVLREAFPGATVVASAFPSHAEAAAKRPGGGFYGARVELPSPVQGFIHHFDCYKWPIDPALCWTVRLYYDWAVTGLLETLRDNGFRVQDHDDCVHFGPDAREFLERVTAEEGPYISDDTYVHNMYRRTVHPASECSCHEWWSDSDPMREYHGYRMGE